MDYVVEMRNITKLFPFIVANDDVTFQLKKGEIHALLGENGAGKSTLMSVLMGLYEPEKGEIFVRGQQTKITNPSDANRLGIGMVHQHFKLVDCFTTLENIVLGVETTRRGVLQMKESREKVMALCKRYGLSIDPDAKISGISVGMQQRVEIIKMLYRDNDILIFDEPTAVLTPQEIDELTNTMKGLVQEGKSIIFISHKLAEIKKVADRCTVLRKGKYVATVDVADVTMEDLSELMVGRKVMLKVDKTPAQPTEPVLQVRDLEVQLDKKHKNKVNKVSFDVRKGEIVCVAGIDNNGQTELVLALAGLLPATAGKILIHGKDVTESTVRERNVGGMSHIPEDRHKHGLVLDFNLAENLVLQSFFTEEFARKGFLRFDKIYAHARRLIQEYDIRCAQGPNTGARSMSGGNQQKAILAREIDRAHDLLIAVQPTRGVDVGAIEFIHKQLIRERDAGKAVLLISLELDEVMDVSDRVLVIYEGEIVANVDPKKVTEQEFGLYMSGSKREDVAI